MYIFISLHDNIDIGTCTKMAEKADNKRNLSDMSNSFSDVVRTPKTSREESEPDVHKIATSTPVSKLDPSKSPTLRTVNNQIAIGKDDILRIATAIRLCIQDEIFELVHKEGAKAVEPL